jgi:stage III sporulation protein SpoIIIAA
VVPVDCIAGVSHVGLGSARCIRCAQRGLVPDAVDHTVGRHAIGAIVIDGVCTAEAVSAVLRARRRGVAVVASIGSPSLPAAACDEVFRPLFGKPSATTAKLDYMRSASFDVAVVLNGIGQWIVHPFVNPSVEAVLTGGVAFCSVVAR